MKSIRLNFETLIIPLNANCRNKQASQIHLLPQEVATVIATLRKHHIVTNIVINFVIKHRYATIASSCTAVCIF